MYNKKWHHSPLRMNSQDTFRLWFLKTPTSRWYPWQAYRNETRQKFCTRRPLLFCDVSCRHLNYCLGDIGCGRTSFGDTVDISNIYGRYSPQQQQKRAIVSMYFPGDTLTANPHYNRVFILPEQTPSSLLLRLSKCFKLLHPSQIALYACQLKAFPIDIDFLSKIICQIWNEHHSYAFTILLLLVIFRRSTLLPSNLI